MGAIDPTRLVTFGHGTLDVPDLVALLRGAGIGAVVDIRRFPGSRRHPHVAREAMERWLADAGVGYRWEERLGGRRKGRADSRHVALRNDSFRAYADHMETAEFAAALDEVLAEASRSTVAVQCSESVWWRCHRRLLSDVAVLARDVEVVHLFHDGRLQPHPVTPEARLDDQGLVAYDDGQERLGL